MNKLASRSAKFGTLCSLLLGTAPGVFAADVVLQKVPAFTVEQAPAYPTNLARVSLGATVEANPQGSAATSLLSGDPTASYSLADGKTTLLVSLPKVENVDSVAFQSIGAKGSVTIATSNAKLPADSPQWRDAAQQDIGADGVKAKVGPSEAKYVRLTFNVTKPGNIAGFGVYATPAMSDFTAPRGHENSATFGLVSYTRADIHTKARALYVSSGADLVQANKMIDDQTATTYSFDANDGSPTAVIDLGKTSNVRRLSAVYSAKPGKMQFYLLQSLPGAAAHAGDLPQTVKFDDAAFKTMKPVGSSNDDGSLGRASVDFPETSGRYVMVRWTPAAQADSSFTMAEIAAIGGSGKLLAANTGAPTGASGDDLQTSDGKTMLDGKTLIEPKDMPAEGPQSPAEGPPPTLPQPPPFTFVPVLVPNSP